MPRSKTLQQQVDFTAGQVLALRLVVHTLLSHAPDKAARAAELHQALERQIAAMIPSSLTEEMLRGVESTRDAILTDPAATQGRAASRRSTPPRPP